MAEGVSEIPKWLKFFEKAGIKVSNATNYAVLFSEHRIQEDMVEELTKDYLTDMGISAMGDIIAILRHSRIHSMPQNGASTVKESLTAVRPVKASAALTRIVTHHLSSSPTPPANHSSRAHASRLALSAPEKASKLGVYQASNGSGKGSVFSRLDLSGRRPVNSMSAGSKQSGRMRGLKRSSSMMADRIDGSYINGDDEEEEDTSGPPLEYKGVLKNTVTRPPARKIVVVESDANNHADKSPASHEYSTRATVGGIRTAVGGTRTDVGGTRTDVGGTRTDVGGTRSDVGGTRTDVDGLRTAVGGSRTAGILSPDARASTPSAKQRLGITNGSRT